MNPRNFVTIPTFWKDDHRIGALSEDAYMVFFNLALNTDGEWRFEVDPSNDAHTVRTCCFKPQRRFRAWQTARVSAALTELVSGGFLMRHRHDDRHWLQVAQAYRYEKGGDPMGAPRAPEQPMLPLEPGLTALKDAKKRTGRPPKSSFGGGSESIESREEKSKANDSARKRETGSRVLSHGAESGRFARDADAVPGDEQWDYFLRTLPPKEVVERGAYWEKQWKEHRVVLAEACMDWRAKTPAEQQRGGGNAGAYFEAALKGWIGRDVERGGAEYGEEAAS